MLAEIATITIVMNKLPTIRGVNIQGVFVENLVRLLREKGWSMAELARRAGVSQGYISMIVAGSRIPTLTKAQNIASALGVSLAAMLGGDVNADQSDYLLSMFRECDEAAQSLILQFAELQCRASRKG